MTGFLKESFDQMLKFKRQLETKQKSQNGKTIVEQSKEKSANLFKKRINALPNKREEKSDLKATERKMNEVSKKLDKIRPPISALIQTDLLRIPKLQVYSPITFSKKSKPIAISTITTPPQQVDPDHHRRHQLLLTLRRTNPHKYNSFTDDQLLFISAPSTISSMAHLTQSQRADALNKMEMFKGKKLVQSTICAIYRDLAVKERKAHKSGKKKRVGREEEEGEQVREAAALKAREAAAPDARDAAAPKAREAAAPDARDA